MKCTEQAIWDKSNLKKYQINISTSFCVGHLVLGMGPAQKCGWCIQKDSIEEAYFSFCEKLSMNVLWFSDWAFSTNLLSTGTSSVLDPCSSWAYDHRVCGRVYVSVLLCLEVVTLVSSIPFGSCGLSTSPSISYF